MASCHLYMSGRPDEDNGQKTYTLTVKDVPVDSFWSITVYKAKGLEEVPGVAISVNGATTHNEQEWADHDSLRRRSQG